MTQKSGSTTINGSNSGPNIDEIHVQVGGSATADGFADYWIRVEGVGELDPRVKVIESARVYYNQLINEVNSYLIDEFDVTLAEIIEVYRTYRETDDSSP